jgi:ATP-dependent Lhr-like helicase
VLERIHAGGLRLVARDTPEPSLFAHEILNARPYAFLDDAPLEERRAHAVQTRRAGEPSAAGDVGALDQAAIERVREEERPDPRDANEAHDTLMTAGFLTDGDIDSGAAAFIAPLVSARRAARVLVPAGDNDAAVLWMAAERLPEIRAVHANASITDGVTAPASRAARAWSREEAIVELIRGRMSLAGPTTAEALALTMRVGTEEIENALLTLESQGGVLRGRFTECHGTKVPECQGQGAIEWCERTLLARIHRYTLNRLRAEIEPVSAADFMRFLFRWQHVEPSTRLSGLDGLREAVAMLDGFELAAGAWERSVLPARLDRYEPAMLDMLCLAGEVAWGRLSDGSNGGRTQLVPATPVALFLREHDDAWQALGAAGEPAGGGLGENALSVLAVLRRRGASFLSDIGKESALDRAQLREAIGTLVACGLARSDGFSGLRTLLRASHARRDPRGQFSGRWAAVTPSSGAGDARAREDAIETQAWALLRRYGVVFRRLLAREANAAPWRELTRVYRRLEARGEIRGGRFVSGMPGEQFALPRAIEAMREVRRDRHDGRLIAISTADPLNLAGIVTPGERLRVAGRNMLVYRDGVPLAVREGRPPDSLVRELTPLDDPTAAEVFRIVGQRRPHTVLT